MDIHTENPVHSPKFTNSHYNPLNKESYNMENYSREGSFLPQHARPAYPPHLDKTCVPTPPEQASLTSGLVCAGSEYPEGRTRTSRPCTEKTFPSKLLWPFLFERFQSSKPRQKLTLGLRLKRAPSASQQAEHKEVKPAK